MATTSWNPWTELETFTRELQRAFDCPTTRPSQKGNGPQESWKPRMDVSETDAAYIIEADVPGLTIQDITVQLEGATRPIHSSDREDAVMSDSKSAKPGERWLVNLQAIEDTASNALNEVPATLEDFDPRTETWTVQPEGSEQSVALLAKHLIKRLS